ncbi:MAG: dTMP kinase [Proteobacteria bacterium]|nr:dTMP kinase [Pseudomonadota bacterium]
MLHYYPEEKYQRFFVLEGCDGSGKSTLAKLMGEKLQELGYSVLITQEPGGTPLALKMRDLFATPSSVTSHEQLTAESELLLVSAARSQHIRYKIIPGLNDGKIVICDRFSDSTRVYQGLVGGNAKNHVESLIHMTSYGLTSPVTLILDGNPEIFLSRLNQRKSGKGHTIARFDQKALDFHQKIRQGFLQLARQDNLRYYVLPADTLGPDELLPQALSVVTKFLKRR